MRLQDPHSIDSNEIANLKHSSNLNSISLHSYTFLINFNRWISISQDENGASLKDLKLRKKYFQVRFWTRRESNLREHNPVHLSSRESAVIQALHWNVQEKLPRVPTKLHARSAEPCLQHKLQHRVQSCWRQRAPSHTRNVEHNRPHQQTKGPAVDHPEQIGQASTNGASAIQRRGLSCMGSGTWPQSESGGAGCCQRKPTKHDPGSNTDKRVSPSSPPTQKFSPASSTVGSRCLILTITL